MPPAPVDVASLDGRFGDVQALDGVSVEVSEIVDLDGRLLSQFQRWSVPVDDAPNSFAPRTTGTLIMAAR